MYIYMYLYIRCHMCIYMYVCTHTYIKGMAIQAYIIKANFKVPVHFHSQ